MDTLLPTPSYFAHRGASALAPENTLASFRRALQMGAPAIELDVKLSADGTPVVIHDPSVQRTTNGSGLIRNLPLAALRELDAGSWFGAEFAGEKIPMLEEVLAEFGQKLIINIELTNYNAPFDGLAAKVCHLVQKHGLDGRILFSSFFPTNLAVTRRLLPNTPRGQLILPGNAGGWQRLAAKFMNIQAEHPYYPDVSAQNVQNAHAKGRRVHAWTVNDPADMRRLRQQGVDAIFTDDPSLAQVHFIPLPEAIQP